MSGQNTTSSQLRIAGIRRALKRHRLVFVQMGRVFDPLRDELLAGIGGWQTTVSERLDWIKLAEDQAVVVISDLESCVAATDNVLGQVREIVLDLLDRDKMVCLVSRSPRIAFTSVAGSSVLEDAALSIIPLLTKTDYELGESERPPAGWPWPATSQGEAVDAPFYRSVLSELGQGLISVLDHALFEIDPKSSEGLQFLSAREVEGLRGCGLVELDRGGKASLVLRSSAKVLREALAAHVSETVDAAGGLSEVTIGLWYIERRIRAVLRAAALDKFGVAWRASVLGGLKDEVLRRAQQDTNVTAKTVDDLRDPLEWLTLGELMDIVRGPKFNQLGVEAAIWRKLQEQLIPVRNRLAHVRMLRANDEELVVMWAKLIRARFGG